MSAINMTLPDSIKKIWEIIIKKGAYLIGEFDISLYEDLIEHKKDIDALLKLFNYSLRVNETHNYAYAVYLAKYPPGAEMKKHLLFIQYCVLHAFDINKRKKNWWEHITTLEFSLEKLEVFKNESMSELFQRAKVIQYDDLIQILIGLSGKNIVRTLDKNITFQTIFYFTPAIFEYISSFIQAGIISESEVLGDE